MIAQSNRNKENNKVTSPSTSAARTNVRYLILAMIFTATTRGGCIVGDVSPKQAMGISGDMFNFCSKIASIVTSIIIGVLVSQSTERAALKH